VRGEVFRLEAPRHVRGHEQAGRRFAVVVQSDSLPLSTWVVAPTSVSAQPATFRPQIEVLGTLSRVMTDQVVAVDPARLGESVGFLTLAEQRAVDAALRTVLDL
jgi:mRNA interferase MazF